MSAFAIAMTGVVGAAVLLYLFHVPGTEAPIDRRRRRRDRRGDGGDGGGWPCDDGYGDGGSDCGGGDGGCD